MASYKIINKKNGFNIYNITKSFLSTKSAY